jgi:chromosomal replication initiator protein
MNLWTEIARCFAGLAGPQVYRMWIENTRLVDVQPERIVLAVDSSETDRHLPARDLLRDAAETVCGCRVTVSVVIEPTFFQDASSVVASRSVGRNGLDSLMTWNGNEVALEAARAFRDDPAWPVLVIYGPPGSGKTSILDALALDLRARDANVLVLSLETFSRKYALAARDRRLSELRERTRGADYLILDDLEALGTKARTQDEILNTFNLLLERGRRVVVATNRPPRDLDELSPGVRNRLRSGMEVSVRPPGFADRVKFLTSLVNVRKGTRDEEIVRYLASEGPDGLDQLKAVVDASRTSGTWSMPRVRRILQEQRSQRDVLLLSAEAVARVFGISVKDLRGTSRCRTVNTARQAACWTARRETEKTLREIGAYFGNRNHSTVIFSIRKAEELKAADAEFEAQLEAIHIEFSAQLVG